MPLALFPPPLHKKAMEGKADGEESVE